MALKEIHLYRSPNIYLQNGFLPLNQADFEYFPLRSDFLPDLGDKSAFENWMEAFNSVNVSRSNLLISGCSALHNMFLMEAVLQSIIVQIVGKIFLSFLPV